MPVDEILIKKLLEDTKIDDFEESLLFRSEVFNKSEAADILIRLMHTERPAIARRAQRMLCLFDRPALKPLAKGLAYSGALWRSNLLNILWTIISAHDIQERASMLEDVLAEVMPLLQDRSDVRPEYKGQPEIEYEYRMCDEVYVFVQGLRDPSFDEDIFRNAENEERDVEIRLLQNRLRTPIV